MRPQTLIEGTSDPHCYRCLDNGQMVFETITAPGVAGYVFPGSFKHLDGGTNMLVPLPYMWVVTTDAHGYRDSDGTVYGFSDDWTWHERQLLGLVPTLDLAEGYNLSENVGFDNGERPDDRVKGRHGFRWVITGRRRFGEMYPRSPGACHGTATLGLALIVHRSRQRGGSLPADDVLAGWWNEEPNITTYNERAARFAVNNTGG